MPPVADRHLAPELDDEAESPSPNPGCSDPRDAGLLLLAETAPCIIWSAQVVDPGQGPLQWTVELSEPAADRFFPVAREPGEPYVEAWYKSRLEEDRRRSDRTAGQSIRAGHGYQQEYQCRRADGEIRWLTDHVRVEPLGPGRWSAVGVCIDITERKRTEEQLRSSEARTALALEAARTHLWEVDVETQRLWISPNAEAIFGAVPQSYPEFLELVHPDDRGLVAGGTNASPPSAERFQHEFRVPWPDGTERWVLGLGRLIKGPEGQVRTVIGAGVDVTERKQVEASLRASEEQLRLVVEAANLVVWTWDPVEGGSCAAEAMERAFGYPADSTSMGQNWWAERIHPDDRDAIVEAAAAYMAGTETQWATEYRFRRADGEYAWVADYAKAVRDPDGQLQRIIGAMVDVSQNRLLQDQLAHAQRLEAVGRLAGGVAHDFNNLLSVINGYADLLLGDAGADAPQRRGLEQIQRAGARAAELTRQLLAFGRKQIVSPRLLDMGEVLATTCGMLRRILGEDIEVVGEVEPGLGAVLADPGQLEQVIVNLAVNARDAMPEGGTLTLRLENVEVQRPASNKVEALTPGSYVKLSVTDTGIGIDAEVLPHIFEPFFTTKEMGVGTGLGLATVYGIVKQSGGHVAAVSSLNHGTCITVYLPRQQHKIGLSSARAPGNPAHGKQRLLVVEDEEMLRELLVAVLEESGYEVLHAAGAEEALARCQQAEGKIDLVLTDVVMPGRSGRQLADEIRTLYPGISILYMSGYTDDALVRSGIAVAGANFIQKPFRPQALIKKVNAVLHREPSP